MHFKNAEYFMGIINVSIDFVYNGSLSYVVADQCSKQALVFELVAPPLEQILSGSKRLGLVPYIPKFWQSIILFRKRCNENLKMAP